MWNGQLLNQLQRTKITYMLSGNLVYMKGSCIMETQNVQQTPKEKFIQFIKFTLFSISAGLIQFGSDALFFQVFHFSEWLSYLLALILSVVWNFTLNRRFTFKSAENVPKAMAMVLAYYAVFTPVSTWWTNELTGPSVGWNNYLVLAITMVTNFITEFLFQRFVVFRKSINTNDIAKREAEKGK